MNDHDLERIARAHGIAALTLEERETMGQRLRAARQTAGYSARELARAMGYASDSGVWHWGRGRLPDASNRRILAGLLSVPEGVLFAEYAARCEAEAARYRSIDAESEGKLHAWLDVVAQVAEGVRATS